MKMTNKIAGWARKGILAGAIALGGLGAGCASIQDAGIVNGTDIGYRLGGGVLKNNLSREDRTVYVHPADGGKEKGGVLMSVNRVSGAGLSIFGEETTGPRWLRLKAGIEGRINSFSGEDREDQPLPSPYHSIGWATFSEDSFSWMPYVGVELRTDLDDFAVFLGVNRGWPESGFEFRKGDQRYGIDNTEFSDSWRGYGNSYTVYLGAGTNGKGDGFLGDIYLSWTRDDWNTDICGGTKVKKDFIAFGMGMRF